jgi:hypothetical protein
MKIKWRPLILTGLVVLLASFCVLAGGCGRKTQTEEPKFGPLYSPFSEIIPSAEDLSLSLFISPYRYAEDTMYRPDGVVIYSRTFGNESAWWSSLSDTPKPENPPVLLSMFIYKYQDEERAKNRIQEEKNGKLYDESDTEYYAKLFSFPLEDIAGHVIFWNEPAVKEVRGEEEVYFRIGQYVGCYSIHVDDPPELSDGYFIPIELHSLLEVAVKTTITRLRPIAGIVSKVSELSFSRYYL